MRDHAGIFEGKCYQQLTELLPIALTPGIPVEWLCAVAKLNRIHLHQLRKLMENQPRNETNAASITEADALRMLEVTPTTYRGPVPLYAKLWLQQALRTATDVELAKRFGRNRSKVERWRNQSFFDPITGVRLP